MKNQELRNHIQGSVLKKQFLEAFLLQSAYLEAVVKMIVDFQVFRITKQNTNSELDKIAQEIRDTFTQKSLYSLIDFLFESGVLNEDLKKNLHAYRVIRNKILHDLVTQIFSQKFELEIEEACKLGNKILSDTRFTEMIEAIDTIEEGILKRSLQKIDLASKETPVNEGEKHE
ncbi:DUF4145 domain-containing protein [Candidatus Parcubacteria bacterium]|nr:DUF4145 domain-containing protein [Candidatus Parcubacteria bacterium]